MTYKIPVELIKDKAPKTKKPKKPLTLAGKEAYAKIHAKIHAKRKAEIYAEFLPDYYERKPLGRTTKRKRDGKWNEVKDDFWDIVDELPKEEGEDELRKTIVDKNGIPIKTVAKKAPTHTFEDLKRIKGLKDEIEALKSRIVRKDATIKHLKRKVEKLKEELERPEKEKQEKRDFYIDNPDFLEIN